MTRTTEKKTVASLRELLTGLIDYAGLFPPASLDMKTAVQNYARYRNGEHSWLLGRFIVPATRLEEFKSAAQDATPISQWRLSVLLADAQREMPTVMELNSRCAGRFVVDALELKAVSTEEIIRSPDAISSAFTPYFEIDPAKAPEWLPMIAEVNARAKIRTGGIKQEMFPSAETIAGFIFDCLTAEVAFKATAGLHHPVPCVHALTYESDAPKGKMHGFVSVFVAAVLAHGGAKRNDVIEVIGSEEASEFKFTDEGVTWRGLHAGLEQIKQAREQFAIAFGSCSFEEPVADLQKLDLL